MVTSPRVRARVACVGLLAIAMAILVASARPADGATSSVVVTMDVASATHLDAAACGAGTPSLDFGVVQPGTGAVTAACDIEFGSSNDTASLRLGQLDMRGDAMFQPFDGAIDAGFAAGGDYLLDQSGGNDQFWSADELPDGDIILAGRYEQAVGDLGTLLVRLNPDGSPHGGFGASGIVTANVVPGADDPVWDIQSLGDGTAVLGSSDASGSVGVRRVLADGSFDGAWAGGSGVRLLPEAQLPRVIRIDAAGRVLISGTSWSLWPIVECVVTRMSAAGIVDTGYGAAGSTRIGGTGEAYCDGMDVDRSGRAIVAGTVDFDDALLARLDVDGNVDATFGGGIRQYDGAAIGTTQLGSVVVRPDGGVVVGGEADGRLWLEQYDEDGAPTASFGPGGSRDYGGSYTWHARALAWIDGRVVVAGDYGNSRLARVLSNGDFDPSFSDDGYDDPALPGATDDEGMQLLGDGRVLLYGQGGGVAQARMYDADALPQHANTTADWNDGPGFFGACLASVSGSGAAVWNTGACAQADGAWWNDVPAAAETVATSPAGDDTVVASLRFGARVPAGQAPGSYVAPVRLEVVAPSV